MFALRSSVGLPLAAIFSSIFFLCIGTSWAKSALFPVVGAQGSTALRLGFSALLMLLFWRPWRMRINGAEARSIALYGSTLGIMGLAFYLSLRTLPLGIAEAIAFIGPLGVAMATSRRMTDFVWIGLAIVGLGLLLPVGQDVGALDPTGMAWAALSGTCWGCYIVFGKRVGHLPISITAPLGAAVAALVAVPVGVVHAGAALFSPSILLSGLGVALVSSAIPISLELFALKHLPKRVFGTMTSMEPAVAAVLALVFLGEVLDLTQCVAIVLIMAASMGCAMTVQSTTTAVAPAVPTAKATRKIAANAG